MWIDADRAHPQGGELYERLLDQAVAWGVQVFEHDWLIECFLGVRGLRTPGRAGRVAGGHRRGTRAPEPERPMVHGVAGRLRADDPPAQRDLDPHER